MFDKMKKYFRTLFTSLNNKKRYDSENQPLIMNNNEELSYTVKDPDYSNNQSYFLDEKYQGDFVEYDIDDTMNKSNSKKTKYDYEVINSEYYYNDSSPESKFKETSKSSQKSIGPIKHKIFNFFGDFISSIKNIIKLLEYAFRWDRIIFFLKSLFNFMVLDIAFFLFLLLIFWIQYLVIINFFVCSDSNNNNSSFFGKNFVFNYPCHSNIISKSPGLFSATNDYEIKEYDCNNPETYKLNVERIENLLSNYYTKKNIKNKKIPFCNYGTNFNGNCLFDTNLLGPCSKEGYGFKQGKPCIYLMMSKIINYKPDSFSNSTGYLPIKCHTLELDTDKNETESNSIIYNAVNSTNKLGRSLIEKINAFLYNKPLEDISIYSVKDDTPIKTYPKGILLDSLPFQMQPNYSQPLVAIQLDTNRSYILRCSILSPSIHNSKEFSKDMAIGNIQITVKKNSNSTRC